MDSPFLLFPEFLHYSFEICKIEGNNEKFIYIN